MTPEQYRDALQMLGISQPEAGKVFGFNDRASRRYAAGQEIPWSLEMLLNLMIAKHITVDDIEEIPEDDELPSVIGLIFYLLDTGVVTVREALTIGLNRQRASRFD